MTHSFTFLPCDPFIFSFFSFLSSLALEITLAAPLLDLVITVKGTDIRIEPFNAICKFLSAFSQSKVSNATR